MRILTGLIALFLSSAIYATDSANYFGDESDELPVARHKPRYSASMQKLYSYKLCEEGEYDCITVKRGKNWNNLFPDEKQRDIVKRLNRTNLRLKVGQPLAIPENLDQIDVLDVAPFDRKMDTGGKKLIIVSLPKLAFGAYDESGNLVYWGPVSGGRDICPEDKSSCKTVSGIFNIFQKKGEKCISGVFPVNRSGGAPMPYCMFFLSGFALHGSKEVPGYNASHGCVRLYTEDAKWLNKNFVEVTTSEYQLGTEVIVQTADNDDQSTISDDPYESQN